MVSTLHQDKTGPMTFIVAPSRLVCDMVRGSLAGSGLLSGGSAGYVAVPHDSRFTAAVRHWIRHPIYCPSRLPDLTWYPYCTAPMSISLWCLPRKRSWVDSTPFESNLLRCECPPLRLADIRLAALCEGGYPKRHPRCLIRIERVDQPACHKCENRG